MPIFVVSTPIGNLKDITENAIHILKSCSYILSEDTRTTGLLLSHFQITGKKILNFTDHTKENEYLKFLEDAKVADVALVSEAGTPCISDPGYTIIKKAHEMGIKVIPIVGASSLIAAISVCGLPFQNFAFLGFYTKSTKEKTQKLLSQNLSVAIFLPARDIQKVLQDMAEILENYEICIARELTKMYEDIKKGTLLELMNYYKEEQKLQGEAILLASSFKLHENKQDLSDVLRNILKNKSFLKMETKQLVEILKHYEPSLASFSKKEIYNTLINLF